MNSVLVRHKWEPYIWLLPSILLMTIFVVFPIGIVFKLAFSEISKAGIVGGFVGFANFKEAVSAPVFGTVMLNTVVWVVSVVGLSHAVRLHHRDDAQPEIPWPQAGAFGRRLSVGDLAGHSGFRLELHHQV